jgi:hypothetical protein
MSIALGNRHTFTSPTFQTSAGTATDPTTATKFYLREHVDGTELEWTYNASPTAGTHYPVGMQPIVRVSAGLYTLAYDTRKPERVTGFWVGTGTVYDALQETLFVRHSELAILDPPSS